MSISVLLFATIGEIEPFALQPNMNSEVEKHSLSDIKILEYTLSALPTRIVLFLGENC